MTWYDSDENVLAIEELSERITTLEGVVVRLCALLSGGHEFARTRSGCPLGRMLGAIHLNSASGHDMRCITCGGFRCEASE